MQRRPFLPFATSLVAALLLGAAAIVVLKQS